MHDVIITPSWDNVLAKEISKTYFKELMLLIQHERDSGKHVFPATNDVFNAFHLTPIDEVKVLLLGQDPYHGANQAHGLCFSVPDGVKIPPSLRNIFQELETDIGIPKPQSGNLSSWATQGVLMLNSVLTVEEGKAASHSKMGWQTFTDAVIQLVSAQHEHVVFLLWGQYAQRKIHLIDSSKHLILTSSHPSPLSYYGGFKGCRHFSATNAYLIQHKKKPIQWG